MIRTAAAAIWPFRSGLWLTGTILAQCCSLFGTYGPRLCSSGVVANPRDTTGYRCGLRLARGTNPLAHKYRTVCNTALATALLSSGLGVLSLPVAASQHAQSRQVFPIALADLPRQGQQTYQLILQGGPFPHEKDGVVFGNYERQLPLERRGYYHEYTVDTPGARGRGGRRIVCGGLQRTVPAACYYTGDHYLNFKKIVP